MAVGKNIAWKKRERGSNLISHIMLRFSGRISSWQMGMGRKSRFKKMGMERISSCMELHTPLFAGEAGPDQDVPRLADIRRQRPVGEQGDEV